MKKGFASPFLLSLFRYLQGKNFKFQSKVACGDQIVLSSQTDDICFSLDIKHFWLMKKKVQLDE